MWLWISFRETSSLCDKVGAEYWAVIGHVQRADLFLHSTAEYEPYVNTLGPGIVQQGDLTDPYYFDFISFAQYLTINREITQDPPLVFEEKQPVEVGDDQPQKFVNMVVRRDPSITNDMLEPEHSRRVGEAILNRFDEKLGDTPISLSKLPPGSRPDAGTPPSKCLHLALVVHVCLTLFVAEQMLNSFSQLVKLFLINGFAWDGSASFSSGPSTLGSASGAEFSLNLVSPATIWGGQCLQLQRTKIQNSFLYVCLGCSSRFVGFLHVHVPQAKGRSRAC